jgi:hypothetical protein
LGIVTEETRVLADGRRRAEAASRYRRLDVTLAADWLTSLAEMHNTGSTFHHLGGPVMSNFQKLYDNPEGVGSQFAIVVSGTGAQRSAKGSVKGTQLALEQVKSSFPMYAQMIVSADHLQIQASGSKGSETPQVYFLPWAKRTIYRVRPKPANTPGLDGNLFFTPNLDGCMITIDGSPEHPTIYHSNSSGAPLSKDEDMHMKSLIDEPTRNQFEAHAKTVQMAKGVEAFQTFAKKKPTQVGSGLAARKDYDYFEYDKGSKTELKMNKFDGVDKDFDACYGAVFGVRKSGRWIFYKQSFRILQRSWDEEQKGFLGLGKSKIVRVEIKKYAVISAKKFWP